MSKVLKVIGITSIVLGAMSAMLGFMQIDIVPYFASLFGVHYLKIVPSDNSAKYVFPMVIVVVGLIFIGSASVLNKKKSS